MLPKKPIKGLGSRKRSERKKKEEKGIQPLTTANYLQAIDSLHLSAMDSLHLLGTGIGTLKKF